MIRTILHKLPRLQTLFNKTAKMQRIMVSKHGIAAQDIHRNALKVCNDLENSGYQAFLVGGAVRDLLIGVPPKDFDVATNATPEQVKQQFRRALIIGKRFRLVHVIFGNDIIETSTFRKNHSDTTQTTDEQGRILRDNHYGTLEEDAARRDFTINGLYYQPSNQTIIDFHDGVKDIQKRMIRMIGDAPQRYREDPVRMLRAIRFSAKLQFNIAPETSHPIHELYHLLGNVPASRRFDELLKLLACGHTVDCLDALVTYHLHQFLLPDLPVLLQNATDRSFLIRGFERSDHRVQTGLGISSSMMFAILFWPLVWKQWQSLQKEQHSIEALNNAIHEVTYHQNQCLPLQKRFLLEMREIWHMQPRFEKGPNKSAWKMLHHPRFRAACDFLQIRAACHQVDSVLAQWWMDFANAPSDQKRQELITHAENLLLQAKPARKKRSRRKAAKVTVTPSAE